MDPSIVVPALLSGLWRTLVIFGGAAALGIVVSFIMGLARLARWRWLRWPALGYIEVFRGTSAFVQLFWLYYALPLLTGIYAPALLVAILGVGMNTSAYGAEVVRSAITGVDRGQAEAARALGLGPLQTLHHILIPQAIPRMIPPFGNLLIETLKNSALAMAVSVPELFYQARRNLTTQDPQHDLSYYLIVLGVYFLISLAITAATRAAERCSGAFLEPAHV